MDVPEDDADDVGIGQLPESPLGLLQGRYGAAMLGDVDRAANDAGRAASVVIDRPVRSQTVR